MAEEQVFSESHFSTSQINIKSQILTFSAGYTKKRHLDVLLAKLIMNYKHNFYVFCIFLTTISPWVHAQQPYIRKATTLCDSTDNSTSVLGYACNGVNRSCQAYLTFRSQPPFNTVSSISALLAADPTELSQLNSVPETETFETNKVVFVPVQCSCSGQYYQVNASYVIQNGNTYLLIANDTYQGLSTCQALKAQNSNRTRDLFSGTRINVPLRCACPTKNQTDDGVKYLLSYLITWGEFVSSISAIFGVDTGKTLAANGLSEQDTTVYPFTTLLVPLENSPSNLQISPPPPPPPQQPPPELVPSSDNSSSKTWIYVVAVVAALAIVLITGAVVYYFFRKKKKMKKADTTFDSESFEAAEKPLNKGLDENSEGFWESISSIAESLEVYKFEELKSATNNFSPDCLIQGSVYRGTINGDFAAIKRMNGDVSKEISLLNKINHFNLIRLSGVGFNDGQWYLVYEYAANGPLSDWIFNNITDQKFLNWQKRLQIALDVATGLNYLHSYTSPPHVHKDLRINNVLLDSDLRAKIANFTLARSAEPEGQFVLTRHIVGTKGYMAPEYLENGLVSPKLDVYAFGVLMLEMLTGKEISLLYEDVKTQLSEVLNSVLQEEDSKEKLSSFLDPSLQGNYPVELAIQLIRLIDRCINEDPSARPGMSDVVQYLSTTMTATLSWELSLGVSGNHSMG